MARFSHRQTDFGSGELGEKLSGRIDLAEYPRGLKRMRGFYPTPAGGAVYSPGARTVTGPNGQTLHKYYDPAAKEELQLAIRGDSGDFDVEMYTTAGAVKTIDGVAVRTAINNLAIEFDKNKFSFAQIGEILFITHASGQLKPIVLSVENGVFVLRFFDEAPNRLGLNESLSYPFDSKNVTTTTVISTPTELQSSSAIFSADDVGTWFRLETDAGAEGVFYISAFINTTSVNYTDFSLSTGYVAAASVKWAKSTWSQARGWPKLVTIMDGRTIFANTDINPTGFWASELNNFFLFTEERYVTTMPEDFVGYTAGLLNTDAFSFSLSSGEAREIRWLTSQRSLHLGTDEGEYVVTEGGGTFGAELQFSVRQQTSHGSSFVGASKADRASIYVSRDGTRLRNFIFSEENGSYLSQDLSILSEDIIRHLYDKDEDRYSDIQIEKTIWDRDRSIIWVLTTTGAFLGVTIVPTSNTVGWFARPIGGDGKVVSMSEVVDPTSNKTFIFLRVDRDGVFSTEKIGPNWESDRMPPAAALSTNPNSDHIPYYLDKSSRKEADGLTPKDFDMGEFIVGDEVTALEITGDVYSVNTYTVVAGGTYTRQIVIDSEPDYIVVGFPYEGLIESMNIEAGGIIGNAQSLVKSIEKLFVRVSKSIGGLYGSKETNLKPLKYKNMEPTCAFTGDIEVLFPSDPGEKHQYIIKQDKPLPLNISAVFMRGETQG